MPLSVCPIHQSREKVLCWAEGCEKRYCRKCFPGHKEGHEVGVVLCQEARRSMIKWSEFLLLRLKELDKIIRDKGYSSFFILRLESQFPRNLVGQVSKAEIEEIALQSLVDYEQLLIGNIEYMSGVAYIEELDAAGFYRDLYKFYAEDASLNFKFLIDKLEGKLKNTFPHKEIYKYTHFIFSNKELSQIETVRKELAKETEKAAVFRTKQLDELASLQFASELSQSKKLHSGIDLVDISQMLLNFTLGFQLPEEKEPAPAEQQLIPATQEPAPVEQPPAQKQDIHQSAEHGEAEGAINKANVLLIQNEALKIEVESLREQLAQKEKSICELNKLINNEEEQLLYRENEVEVLTGEIKKLISFKEKNESTGEQLSNASKELALREKQIKELQDKLNADREKFQSEISSLKNEIEDIKSSRTETEQKYEKLAAEALALSSQIQQLKQENQNLKKEAAQTPELIEKIKTLSDRNDSLQALLSKLEGYDQSELSAFEQLLTEVVEKDAALSDRNEDLSTLVKVVNELSGLIPQGEEDRYRLTLEKLKSVSVMERR